MKVTFLRHAISIYNEMKASEKDCELSAAGKAQAADLSGSFDVVVCSFMTRTKQTLGLSKIQYNELHYSEVCREVQTCVCDYKPDEEEVPETVESVCARVSAFCEYLKQFEGRNVLVVSHGDFIYHLNGKTTKYLENAEFQVIDV